MIPLKTKPKKQYQSVVLIFTHNLSGLSNWCSHRHLYVRQLVFYSEMCNLSTVLWTKPWVYLYLFWCFHLRHSHHQRKLWPLLPVWSHVHTHRQALPEGCLHFAYMNSQKPAIFSEVVYIVTVFSHKRDRKI